MCLILFAYRCDPIHELVLAANRDEFYARPTEPIQPWDNRPEVIAGRDLQAGGTWLGVTRSGRFAAITNVRDGEEPGPSLRSRGLLVSDFLEGQLGPAAYLESVRQDGPHYSGFNLLVANSDGLYYYSNRGADAVVSVEPGIHGLSNALLDTRWPKVAKGKQRLAAIVMRGTEPTSEELLALLMDQISAPSHSLPDTGVGPILERQLSPAFIKLSSYGTRSSTVLVLRQKGGGWIEETSHPIGQSNALSRSFAF